MGKAQTQFTHVAPALAVGLAVLFVGLPSPDAQARTLRIDTHSKLVQTLMQRHRRGTRYRFGPALLAKGDLDADWIAIRNTTLLRQLTWLRSLSLSRATLPGFAFLKRLKRLERLDLSKTQISSLRPLAGLTRLRQLDLSATRVKDLRPLVRCTSLMDLRLSETPVQDLSALRTTTLARLELGSSNMTRLPKLSTLAVDTLVITDAKPGLDFAPMAQAQVTTLILDATGVIQVKGLAGHPTLRAISLYRTRVTLRTVQALLKKNRTLQIVTPKGRTVGSVVRWLPTRPRLSNYPCLNGQGACTRETFGWERRRVLRWIAP